MANKPIKMHKIKQIIRLWANGISRRQIALQAQVHRNVVSDYITRCELTGRDFMELLDLPDDLLWNLLYSISDPTAPIDARFTDFQTRLSHFHSELKRSGVTRQLLWKEYLRVYPTGYGYTQFCEYLRRDLAKRQSTMHFEHKAGACAMIDFAGKKLSYIDTKTGELISNEVLIMTLPCSNYCYVEAVPSQKMEDFLGAIARGFTAFGGVPERCIIDNLKSGVVKPDRYEPTLTAMLEQLSSYYNCPFIPARVYKPKDKASVERHVQIVYQQVYAPIRDVEYHSLQALNDGITHQLASFHQLPFQRNNTQSRLSLFTSVEQPALKALPAHSFDIRFTASYKVQRNYHVQLGQDKHYYSVPYKYIGSHVDVVYTSQTVEIYLKNERIATHLRNRRANGYTTHEAHMPPNHVAQAKSQGYSATYFIEQAQKVGHSCTEVVKTILESKIFEQQAYLSCKGILSLLKTYPAKRLELACKRAARCAKPNFGMVRSILQGHLDRLEEDEEEKSTQVSITPSLHENLRGSAFYQ
jgi:transposase